MSPSADVTRFSVPVVRLPRFVMFVVFVFTWFVTLAMLFVLVAV